MVSGLGAAAIVHESADPTDRGVDPRRAEQDERDLGRRAESRRPVHEADRQGNGAEHREQRSQRHAPSSECDGTHDTESE
jgi:hypothetical protein